MKNKEKTLDNKFKTYDDMIEDIHKLNRSNRDLASAKEAKNNSEANVKSNKERVAYEKD